MNFKNFLKGVMSILVFIIFSLVCTYFSYLISNLIFIKLGLDTKSFLFQVVNTLFEFIFLLIGFLMIFYFAKVKLQKYLDGINHVIKTISKGEYNVKLKDEFKEEKEFSNLVENINTMTENLDKLEKMRQDFVSNVSHEIKSPLTSIRGFAQMLRSNNLTEEQKLKYLDIIDLESVRLNKLSENMLRLAALESGSVDLKLESYRVDKQIKEVILALEPHWIKKDIYIDLELEESYALADKDLIGQVWINLIQNSIKFSEEKSTIKVSSIKREDQLEITIEDSGIGIDKESLEYIFDKFYKVDKSRNNKLGGNGLGLSIVKKLVDINNGEIKVSSEVGNGTVIKVILLCGK